MAYSDYEIRVTTLNKSVTKALTKLKDLASLTLSRLNNHILQRGNVHHMTKADIGLGNVPNWSPATQVQAEKCTSTNSNMSPRRVNDQLASNLYSPLGTAFDNATNDL